MLKHRRLFTLALLLGCAASASAGMPTREERDQFLHSILRRADDVLVSNDAGIFRAPLDRKEWQKLELPAEMPLGGEFAKTPVGSPQILYYTRGYRSRKDGKKAGLYGSTDSGKSWRLLLDSGEIGKVLMLSSGDLFVTRSDNPMGFRSSIEVSNDMGQTWRDITGASAGQLIELIPDPDHPGLICVLTNSIQGYVWQADDEKYHWKVAIETQWRREHSDGMFFGWTYSTGATHTPLYMFRATLGNYFEYDFGAAPYIPAIDLRPDRDSFAFQQGEPIEIPVTIRFLENPSDRAPVREQLLDHSTNLGLWGIRVERGQARTHRPPAISASLRRIGEEGFAARIRGEPGRHAELEAEFIQLQKEPGGWQAVELSATTPYRRRLDLGKFYEFSDPGTYRVQIDYDNEPMGDRKQGHWVGTFSSSVFTVVIAPSE